MSDLNKLESVSDAARQRLSELKARADRAEAAAAEMRACISELEGTEIEYGLAKRLAACLQSDCGKGWLSPEKAKELQAELKSTAQAHGIALVDLTQLQARNQRLREAIRRAQLAIHQDDEYEADAVLERALAANQKEQA